MNMELEQQLRVALQFSEPGTAPLEAVMARLSATPGPASRDKRRGARRIVIIGVVALAAAAAMLVIKLGAGAPPPGAAVTATIPALSPAAPPELASLPATLPVPEPGPAARQPEVAAAAPLRDLPLFPPRPRPVSETTVDLALRKLVERHPELVEGPDTDGAFQAAVVMRRNGSVVNSAARLTDPRDSVAAVNEMRRLMPDNLVGSIQGHFQRKHAQLPDGRALRADMWLNIAIVADDYDALRSSVNVEQLVRSRHADLLLPSNSPEVNRVTVLLTEEGGIERENVELVSRQNPRPAAPMPEMPRTAAAATQLLDVMIAARAEQLAARLGIDVNRIGQIGNLRVQEGINGVTEDANGIMRPIDFSRSLLVDYAWPRRAGESGPSMVGLPGGSTAEFGRGLQQELEQTATRLSPAVTIVERLMPEAFTRPNSDAGMPVVALTTRGEALGAIRMNTRGDEQPSPGAISRQLQQFDARFGSNGSIQSMETLKNKAGATAQVMFAWLGAPEEPSPAANIRTD
jgi:hypothetical protein